LASCLFLWLLPQSFSSLSASAQIRSLLFLLLFGVSVMLGAELLHLLRMSKASPRRSGHHSNVPLAHSIRSTFFRYIALIIPWGILASLVLKHYYFQQEAFRLTRAVFEVLFPLIAIGGLPYIWLTLRWRGERRYEYGDYAMLWLALYRRIWAWAGRKKTSLRLPSRVKKLLLGWLVTAFFLPLMIRFFDQEFIAAAQAFQALRTLPDGIPWFVVWRELYHFLFHLIFIMDAGIAAIAYAIASRWLNNRIRSVDTTMSGWIVCLVCYPPMNYGFTAQWIDYGRFQTEPLITSWVGQSVLMFLILLLFSIYLWATMALGLRFSNLCHRGIVDSGPYRWFRHPAYTCKNIAWWLDNTYVLTSPGAMLAMLAANLIYVLRGLSEERHLRAFTDYQSYCRKVPCRFMPPLLFLPWRSHRP